MPLPQVKAQTTPSQIKAEMAIAPAKRVTSDVLNSEKRGAKGRRIRAVGADTPLWWPCPSE
jgi:hypothetical protein